MPDQVTTSPPTPTTTIATRDRPLGLFGKTREAVLGLLVLRPDERFHLRQVARLSGAGLGPVQRELSALEALGIVTREESGRQVYFQARPDCPILTELRQLLLKTSALAGVLQTILAPFQREIAAAVVFGSAARGQMHVGSDIDLLVIARQLSVRQLGAALRQAGARLGRDVNLNLYRPAEWHERAQAGHPLWRSVMEHPRLLVIGDEHELVRLAQERMAQTASGGRRRGATPLRRHRARPSRRR